MAMKLFVYGEPSQQVDEYYRQINEPEFEGFEKLIVARIDELISRSNASDQNLGYRII